MPTRGGSPLPETPQYEGRAAISPWNTGAGEVNGSLRPTAAKPAPTRIPISVAARNVWAQRWTGHSGRLRWYRDSRSMTDVRGCETDDNRSGTALLRSGPGPT